MKTWYAWATPSGPIHLMKAEDMPVHPNNRVQVQRHEAEIRVIKDGEVVWQRDARADDYAWSNAENHAHHLKVKLMSEYESTLQAAKESSVPIQDQLRARKMCMLFGEIKPDTIYGPFSLRYEIQNTAIVSQNIAGMNVDVKQIAILYDDTPKKEESQRILVNKVSIPSGSNLVEAYETQHRLIVMFSPGDEIPDDHNCDAMGCGSLSHVKYIFTKPD